ncbi:ATP-binding protein [Streptomyces venezuelae]|uniref:ATP-binding protein n=1 Tax=Streptomyces venezuelae TaxID=54571 RepID=A0A5P2CUB2_STRVZ|nr:ATP-binding protein [Streptomyces venezuelae]QES46455.1 ATP-binding protein [Streptomyces venezuelae]
MSAPEMPDTVRTTCAQARAEVDAALRTVSQGMPGAQARRVNEDALLVVSELTANAMRHGGGLRGFAVRVRGTALLICVSDRSEEVPVHVPHDPARPGGFGWLMVQRLSSSVTVERGDGGKTIVAALDLSPEPGPNSSKNCTRETRSTG